MIFAVIGVPPIMVGQIIDISLGGLAFKHFSDDSGVDRQDFTVGIIESGGGLRMSDLPCRKVYDLLEPLSEGYLNFNSTFRMKCCGLAFGNLTDEETVKLNRFIGG
jgi:hypothetical protein